MQKYGIEDATGLHFQDGPLFVPGMMPVGGAVLADTFQHVVGRLDGESVRNLYERDMDCLETESLVADSAIEVDMHVIQGAFFFPFAYLVFDGAAPVVDGMDDMMLDKQFQSPEYAGLVDSVQNHFQIGKGYCPFGRENGIRHQQPYRCRLDSFLLKSPYIVRIPYHCLSSCASTKPYKGRRQR